MKDKKLEEEFNGYFEGVNIPENLTADAKEYVKPKKRFNILAFVKFASIAASFVLVFAIGIGLLLNSGFNNIPPNGGATSPPAVSANTYEVSEVEFTGISGYTLSEIDSSLAFIEKLTYAQNADVDAYLSRFADGKTANVTAKITINSGARYDTVAVVEFTDGVFKPFEDYYGGEGGYYKGVYYLLTRETADDGEPVCKLLVKKDSVKYYFRIKSSDYNSYEKYLDLIL